MSDEIKKAQEQAKSLGIYKIVKNIATQGQNTNEPCEVEWEGCLIKFRSIGKRKQTEKPKIIADAPHLRHLSAAASFLGNIEVTVTSITMPNGTILYRSEEDGEKEQLVTDFRYGKWVERIKAYSEQITAKKRQEAEVKAQQQHKAKLKPFSQIDF